MYYTYAHYRNDNNSLFYIGKGKGDRAYSTDRSKRWNDIVAEAGGHKVEILCEWQNEDDAYEHEKLLISIFRKQIVNIQPGGRIGYVQCDFRTNQFGVNNCMRRPETAKKVADAKRGKTRVDMLKENNPPQHSTKARASRIKSLTGKTRTEEQKLNNSRAQKALPLLQCPHCSQQIKNPGNLKQHVRNKHPGDSASSISMTSLQSKTVSMMESSNDTDVSGIGSDISTKN